MIKTIIKVLDNGDVLEVKCHADFKGIDGLGTCNTKCQWWLDNYLEDENCIMWKDIKENEKY